MQPCQVRKSFLRDPPLAAQRSKMMCDAAARLMVFVRCLHGTGASEFDDFTSTDYKYLFAWSSIMDHALAALLDELSTGEPGNALPARLTDRTLQVVVRDLRRAERFSNEGLEADDDMKRPMCVLIRLLEWRMSESGRTTGLLLSDEGVDRCLMRLQLAVERELVARYLGLRIAEHDDELVAALDLELSACEPVEQSSAGPAA